MNTEINSVPQHDNPTSGRGNQHQLKKYERNPRLLEGGEPVPNCIPANILDYGFSCPREMYVRSVELPRLRDIAVRFSTSQSVLKKWKREQKWDELRALEWSDVARRQWELAKDQIAGVREKERADQLQHWTMMRDALLAMMRKGTIQEQSATGKVIDRPLNPKDMKDITMALSNINKGIDQAMGVDQKVDEIEVDTGGFQTVRRMVYNMKVEAVEESPASLPESVATALPPAAPLPHEVPIKGEVIHGEASQ